MASGQERRYWDSTCFIAILNDEEPWSSTCQRILDKARQGALELVISPITMAETVRPRGTSAPIPKKHQQTILDFFDNDFIHLRVIDRLVARRSLDLCWNLGLHPRDALHVAAALEERCSIFETMDSKITMQNGLEGMKIRNPFLPQQEVLLARMLHEGCDFAFCRVDWLFSEHFRQGGQRLRAWRVGT